jgi:predicted flap endonuclease-1-like 5' DNA nuclease
VAEPEPVAEAEPVAEPEPVAEVEPVVAEAEPVEDRVIDEPEPVAVAEPVTVEPEPVVSGAAPVAFAEPAAEPADQLTRIEGIGPKIAAALVAAEIRTYRQLAGTDVETLKATLKSAGLRLNASLPTWPEQARLLTVGEQNGVADVTGGEPAAETTPPVAVTPDPSPAPVPAVPAEPAPEAEAPATAEQPADVAPATAEQPVELVPATAEQPVELVPAQRVAEPETAVAPDNLALIEGIGPKMANALAAAGITTFERLATSDVATIRAAVSAAGMRASASLPTWPQRARLLANGGNGSAELNGNAAADLEEVRS